MRLPASKMCWLVKRIKLTLASLGTGLQSIVAPCLCATPGAGDPLFFFGH